MDQLVLVSFLLLVTGMLGIVFGMMIGVATSEHLFEYLTERQQLLHAERMKSLEK